MVIDLRKEAPDFRRMLERTVKRYASKHTDVQSAKLYPRVTRIDFTFSLGDSESIPWVSLCLDTRRGSEPDGDWTHSDFALLTRKEWLPAVQLVCNEKKVPVVLRNGKTRRCGDQQLTQTIGEFLVSVLLSAREDGVFAGLPRAKRCELGVEDPTTGEFGWPSYEDRGKENLA
jgi:hypothetical protein